jgi:hypothetical protein
VCDHSGCGPTRPKRKKERKIEREMKCEQECVCATVAPSWSISWQQSDTPDDTQQVERVRRVDTHRARRRWRVAEPRWWCCDQSEPQEVSWLCVRVLKIRTASDPASRDKTEVWFTVMRGRRVDGGARHADTLCQVNPRSLVWSSRRSRVRVAWVPARQHPTLQRGAPWVVLP